MLASWLFSLSNLFQQAAFSMQTQELSRFNYLINKPIPSELLITLLMKLRKQLMHWVVSLTMQTCIWTHKFNFERYLEFIYLSISLGRVGVGNGVCISTLSFFEGGVIIHPSPMVCLARCLAHNKCSVNSCWLNGWGECYVQRLTIPWNQSEPVHLSILILCS